MRINLLLVFCVFFVTACEDDSLALSYRKSINHSDDPMFQQMSAAFQSLPSGVEVSEYSHFHPSGKAEDLQRVAFNLYESLVRPGAKAVSLGCGDIEFCMQVLNLSLELVIESDYQGGKLLMFPSYLTPPYQLAEKAKVSIILYDVQGFENNITIEDSD